MILYDRFMLGLVKPQDLTSEQFDELIHFERSNISLAEITAVTISENVNSNSFIDLQELKSLYYPENYMSIDEVFKNSDKHKNSSTKFMTDPNIYKEYGKNLFDNPYGPETKVQTGDQTPTRHPLRDKLHKDGMDSWENKKTVEKLKKLKKLSPDEHDKIKKDYHDVKYPNRNFNVKVHGDVRIHLHPETSAFEDDHRNHLIQAIQHLSDKGHGQNPGEEIDDKKHGKEFSAFNKDKLDDNEHIKTGLRHFHIPDVPIGASNKDNPNVGRFRPTTGRNSEFRGKDIKAGEPQGHYSVSYHYSPKTNTYYIHKVNSHNIYDPSSKRNSSYQDASQIDTMKNRQHMLEAVKLFQQRYLKKLFKSFW